MSHPNPTHPDAQAARQSGFDAIAHLLPLSNAAVTREARIEVGKVRAAALAAGDWEAVHQASGALDALREFPK